MVPAPFIPSAPVASSDDALQHRPRPLPLFLHMLRSERGDEPARMAQVLAGVRAYQAAPRDAHQDAAPIVARAGRASLRGYGGSGPPVVFVPSLINGPEILDLDGDRSLMRWMAEQGFAPLLVDWGTPTAGDHALDLAGHIETLLLPLVEAIGAPPMLVGYCLGGTIALAAATLRPPRALATIAAPWRFAGFSDRARADMASLWKAARPGAEAIGLLPMDVLQAAFWRLDPARTLAKFEAFGAAAGDDDAVRKFVAVEDWANGGPPLTLAVARELFEDLFARDRSGTGDWRIGGRTIDPAALAMPQLEIISTTDRIVPAAAAARAGTMRPMALGHVGMIVGGTARHNVWAPLAAWLSQAQRNC